MIQHYGGRREPWDKPKVVVAEARGVKQKKEVLPYVRQDFHRDVVRRDQLLDFVVVVLSELLVLPPGWSLEVEVDVSEVFSEV
jgi:hypothetical protein